MTTTAFATLPEPPYYAVIFSSLRTQTDAGEYDHMAERMVGLAQHQPGFLGMESTRGSDGFGMTVSYWSSPEAITHWRAHAEHRVAQEAGKAKWYEHYALRVALVERAYEGPGRQPHHV
jgi:heme-degrading monooxygenase HmoA